MNAKRKHQSELPTRFLNQNKHQMKHIAHKTNQKSQYARTPNPVGRTESNPNEAANPIKAHEPTQSGVHTHSKLAEQNKNEQNQIHQRQAARGGQMKVRQKDNIPFLAPKKKKTEKKTPIKTPEPRVIITHKSYESTPKKKNT
ncbi:hypothetical protein EB14_02259 [Enterococcus faecium]|nr:hypothetical protein [Enterococcus faecium]RBS30816.1 hypothetical protein EB14_02259 [Enterococcus faecium]